jgi:hypothetical protein
MRAQYKINFDRTPRLKKLPEALIISPELRHLYIHTYIHNIGAFCLRMRENRSVRLQMADFKGFVSFVMVFMKNMD